MPRVTIDGIDYSPTTHGFRLTDRHFEVAATYRNSFEVIKWAHDTQAPVAEMEAWARQSEPEPEPEPAKPQKPVRKRGLFGDEE